MNRVLLGIALAFALTAALPSVAAACSCWETPNLCATIIADDSVLEATVDRTEITSSQQDGIKVVTLRDVKALKGEPVRLVTTATHSAACGYEFQTGVRYLIVGHSDAAGTLSVGLCGLTRPLAEARGLLDFLAARRSSPGQDSRLGPDRDDGVRRGVTCRGDFTWTAGSDGPDSRGWQVLVHRPRAGQVRRDAPAAGRHL